MRAQAHLTEGYVYWAVVSALHATPHTTAAGSHPYKQPFGRLRTTKHTCLRFSQRVSLSMNSVEGCHHTQPSRGSSRRHAPSQQNPTASVHQRQGFASGVPPVSTGLPGTSSWLPISQVWHPKNFYLHNSVHLPRKNHSRSKMPGVTTR